MKKIIFLSFFIFALCVPGTSFARVDPVLWLTTDPGEYQGPNPDPWIDESWVTYGRDLTLNVFNSSKEGNAVTVDDIYVVFSVLNGTSPFTLSVNGTPYSLSNFTSTGNHPVLPKHGIFGANTWYMEYNIGSLASLSSRDISLSLNGDPYPIHMDAYGKVWKDDGSFYYAMNPLSHDATLKHTPEPATLSLLGLGLGAFAIKRRRKST